MAHLPHITYALGKMTGDVTAVVSLLCDNLVNLITIQSIMTDVGASKSFITEHIFLSSLSGVILGNLIIFLISFFLRSKFEAAIPFGVDAPTVFFVAYAMQSIYLSEVGGGASSDDALKTAWGNGSLFILTMGLIKLFFTTTYFLLWKLFKIDIMEKLFDEKIFRACLFAIGISLLGMNSLPGILAVPSAGIPALFTLLMVVLPYGIFEANYPDSNEKIQMTDIFRYFPHIFWSLLVGIPLYYILLLFPNDIDTGAEDPEFFNGLPSLDLVGHFVCTDCKSNILQSVTYAVLVFFGGFSVMKGAIRDCKKQREQSLDVPLLGDSKNSDKDKLLESDKDIIVTFLFIDAICTIFTGLMGGVVQTTPYIGYSTYKELGAGHNYSIYTAVMFFLLCVTGGMSYFAIAIPEPVLKPIFVLIAVHLGQAIFSADPTSKEIRRQNEAVPAYIMATFPVMADLLVINGSQSTVLVCLASGFVVSSILWGQATLSIVRGEKHKTMIVFIVLAFFTYFGVIHSWNGEVYAYPFEQDSYLPTSFFVGYLVTGVLGYCFIPEIPQIDNKIVN